MQLFLCHTPLHVLISLLVAQELPANWVLTFVIVEDSDGLHALADLLLTSPNFRIVHLPGAANSDSVVRRTLIQRANARFLRSLKVGAANTVYLFHDLRAESQALLNSANHTQALTNFVLLEDGIALYAPRGLLPESLSSVLKRKIAFGLEWKHARELGLHPRISEVRCFYPHLLRKNLQGKTTQALPTTLHAPTLDKLLNFPVFPSGTAIVIALPHTLSVSRAYLDQFMLSALAYCTSLNASPLFKLHPNDARGNGILREFVRDPLVLPQSLPVEFIFLSEVPVSSFIGCRTSALHIVKALCPHILCFYFEPEDTEAGIRWKSFLESVGILPLPLAA